MSLQQIQLLPEALPLQLLLPLFRWPPRRRALQVSRLAVVSRVVQRHGQVLLPCPQVPILAELRVWARLTLVTVPLQPVFQPHVIQVLSYVTRGQQVRMVLHEQLRVLASESINLPTVFQWQSLQLFGQLFPLAQVLYLQMEPLQPPPFL